MDKLILRENNRLKVIQHIRENVITDRQSISKSLNINISTAKRIVDDLVKDGIVIYLGENESTGGRKSTKVGINYDYGYNVVIKIEVEQVIFSLVNFKPEVVKLESIPFKRGSSFEDISGDIKQYITKLVIESNAEGKTLFSVGIAVSGIVSKDSSTLVSSTLLGWNDINFREIVESWIRIPTFIENDVNCAVIAEHWFGKGKGMDSFVLMTLGKGTGSGIIINNLLFKGSFGGAGEIGHSIFMKDGLQCYCGQKGCLEMYSNENYIVNRLKDKGIAINGKEDLLEVLNSNKHEIKEVLSEFSGNLISGIINMIVVLEPKRIIIGGEMSFIYDYIKEDIVEKVNSNWINMLHQNSLVDVVKSDLGSDNFIKGLAIKLISNVFESQL